MYSSSIVSESRADMDQSTVQMKKWMKEQLQHSLAEQ
jgi:hypothetical protein